MYKGPVENNDMEIILSSIEAFHSKAKFTLENKLSFLKLEQDRIVLEIAETEKLLEENERYRVLKVKHKRLYEALEKIFRKITNEQLDAMENHTVVCRRITNIDCQKFGSMSQINFNAEIILYIKELCFYAGFSLQQYTHTVSNLIGDATTDDISYTVMQVIPDFTSQKVIFRFEKQYDWEITRYTMQHFGTNCKFYVDYFNDEQYTVCVTNIIVSDYKESESKISDFIDTFDDRAKYESIILPMPLKTVKNIKFIEVLLENHLLLPENPTTEHVKSALHGGIIISNIDNLIGEARDLRWVERNPPRGEEISVDYHARYITDGGKLDNIGFGKILKKSGIRSYRRNGVRWYKR